jgi:hypothetical protein
VSDHSVSFERIFQTVQQNVQNNKWPSAVFGVTNIDHILDIRSFGTNPNGTSVDSSTNLSHLLCTPNGTYGDVGSRLITIN